MSQETNEFDAKLVLLGNSGVGKTSLVLRYVQGTYAPDQTSTIGASFMTKRMFLDDWKVKLQIWDTAGQERFRSMTPMYYRGANGAILMYDITKPDSFDAVKDWVRELNANTDDIVIAICGNKKDLENKRAVPFEKADEFAKSIEATCFETSAKDDQGVENLFFDVTSRMVNAHKTKKDDTTTDTGIDISKKKKETPSGTGTVCCGK